MQVGQLVILREENSVPSQWLLGRVVEIRTGDDQVVKAATLRLGNTLVKRSINKLYTRRRRHGYCTCTKDSYKF